MKLMVEMIVTRFHDYLQHGVQDVINLIEKKNKLEDFARNRNQQYLVPQEHLKDIEMHLRLDDGIRGLFSNFQGKLILLTDIMAQLTDKTRDFFTSQKDTH